MVHFKRNLHLPRDFFRFLFPVCGKHAERFELDFSTAEEQ